MEEKKEEKESEIDGENLGKIFLSSAGKMERDNRIEEIYNLITQLAGGNLSYRAPISDDDDEIDAITIGINMLAEELEATTVSKNYLGRIYKGVIDILIVLDSSNIIQEVNETTLKALGYSEQELIGMPFSMLFLRNEPKSLDKLNKELKKRGYYNNFERVFKTKKGKLIPVSLSCSLLTDEKKTNEGVLVIAKDISKIKRTEEQLRGKNEELNTLIYRASHDLKGPLASILGIINLAKSDIEDPVSMKHYIDLIEQSTNRLDSILMDFLELGKITQGTVKYSYIDFEAMIAEILSSFEYLSDYNKIDFRVKIEMEHEYRGKKTLLQTILQNLVENAIKYRNPDEAKSFVRISIRELDNEIELTVQDNGIGIDKDKQDNIFKMFYRAHYQSRGSGLGLYIVKTSVEALKGKISIKSKTGQGTIFSIILPNKVM